MDPDSRVCPFCGEAPGAGVFCAACGRNLAGIDQLPTRAEWAAAGAREPAGSGRPLDERVAEATSAFLAAMHAAGDPGTSNILGGGGPFRKRRPAAWVVRPVHREPGGDLQTYEPGLVLTTDGHYHRMQSQVRGWGQRNFPQFLDTPARDPIDPPAEARLIGELDALLREHGVTADPPLASR